MIGCLIITIHDRMSIIWVVTQGFIAVPALCARFQALTGIGLTIGFCLPTVMAALTSYVSGSPLV